MWRFSLCSVPSVSRVKNRHHYPVQHSNVIRTLSSRSIIRLRGCGDGYPSESVDEEYIKVLRKSVRIVEQSDLCTGRQT